MKLLMLSQEYERAASRQENIEQIRAWRQAETRVVLDLEPRR